MTYASYSTTSYSSVEGDQPGSVAGNLQATSFQVSVGVLFSGGVVSDVGQSEKVVLGFSCDGLLFAGTGGQLARTAPTDWTAEKSVTGAWISESPVVRKN